jgi:DNA-binding MarR family transcriptional regulator
MSNEHYDEFCLGTYSDLTWLERQLLGHYCTRFNPKVTPPRAWPSLKELKRITGAHEKSISRAITGLVRKGYANRVTHASKERGQKAELAPNMEKIRSSIKVTEELPIAKDVSNLQVTEDDAKGNASVLTGNASVPNRSPSGYPKPSKPNKPNKRNYEINHERWQVITSGLNENTKRLINPALNTELLLDKLERKGTRLTAIRDVLARVNFSTSYKVGGLFVKTLEDLAGVKSARENSAMPWCGKCERETRQFEEASIINGVETHNCPTCSPMAKQLHVSRGEENKEFFARLGNVLKSVDD